MAIASTTLAQPYQNASQASFAFWAKPVLQSSDGSFFCPGFEGDTYANSPYSRLTIAWPIALRIAGMGINDTPGLADIIIRKDHRVDQKKPVGSDGARLTVYGANPAQVTVRLTIWTPDQLRVLSEIWKVIFPKGGSQATSYDCRHPDLERYGIKSLMFTGGGGPNPGPVVSSRTYELNAVEFFAPKQQNNAKKRTPAGSIGSINEPSTTTNPTPGSNPAHVGP